VANKEMFSLIDLTEEAMGFTCKSVEKGFSTLLSQLIRVIENKNIALVCGLYNHRDS
jgi:hypothetical protein